MKARVHEKKEAIHLRKRGHSYNDIVAKLGLAKSTLSEWLKDLPLTDEEKRFLKKRRDKNISHGRIKSATALRRKRIERNKEVFLEAKDEFTRFVNDSLFHVGVSLYWAEGSKRNNFFAFSNSDVAMMKLMIVWIEKFLSVNRSDIIARLYTHRPFAHEYWEKEWSKQTQIPITNFRKTVYKTTGLLVKKRPNYKGCLRISLKRSIGMMRKMAFWQKMLAAYHQKQ